MAEKYNFLKSSLISYVSPDYVIYVTFMKKSVSQMLMQVHEKTINILKDGTELKEALKYLVQKR